jgi:hypothetical protein
MNYRRVKVPYLSDTIIKKQADLFRKTHWNNSIPINIEEIIGLKLKIDVVPSPGLQKLCCTDALVSSNWKLIYVDNDLYCDDRYQNRLRFSFAHEIGHFVLHKHIYSLLRPDSISDFYKLYDQIPQNQYSYLEIQAQKFANYLLIPRDKLVLEKEIILRAKEIVHYLKNASRDNKVLNSYLAVPLSEKFGVSETPMQIALNDIDTN